MLVPGLMEWKIFLVQNTRYGISFIIIQIEKMSVLSVSSIYNAYDTLTCVPDTLKTSQQNKLLPCITHMHFSHVLTLTTNTHQPRRLILLFLSLTDSSDQIISRASIFVCNYSAVFIYMHDVVWWNADVLHVNVARS